MADNDYKRTHCAYCGRPLTKQELAGRNITPLRFGAWGHATCRTARYGSLIEPGAAQEQQAPLFAWADGAVA